MNRSMLKRLVLLPLLLSLCGCWSSVEINRLAIVMGIGIDMGEQPDHYMITAQIAKPTAFGASGGGSASDPGNAYVNVQHESIGIHTALRELMRLTSRKLFTLHDKVLVFGRETAETGIASILDYYVRSEEGRYTTSLLMAEEKASDILDTWAVLAQLPTENLQNMLDAQQWTAQIAPTTVLDFLEDMLMPGVAPTMPIVDVYLDQDDKKKAALTGTAVFLDGKMIGRLDLDQTRAMLLIRNRVQKGPLSLRGLDGVFDMEIVSATATLSPSWGNGAFHMTVHMTHIYKVVSATSREDIHSVQVETQIAELIRADTLMQLNDALAHAKSLRADVFGFGQCLYRRFPQQFKAQDMDWPEAFASLEVDFDLTVRVTSTGAALQPIRPKEGFH